MSMANGDKCSVVLAGGKRGKVCALAQMSEREHRKKSMRFHMRVLSLPSKSSSSQRGAINAVAPPVCIFGPSALLRSRGGVPERCTWEAGAQRALVVVVWGQRRRNASRELRCAVS